MKGRTMVVPAALAALLMIWFPPPARGAGASPWSAVSLAVGAQGRWLDRGTVTPNRDVEVVLNGAISLTPHVSITGGGAYGVSGSYVRSQIDARLTATDVNDPNFNVWVGAGRYFSHHPEDGLSEEAGKAGIGWRPLPDKPLVVGLTTAYGISTGRTSVSAALVYAFKITKGVKP